MFDTSLDAAMAGGVVLYDWMQFLRSEEALWPEQCRETDNTSMAAIPEPTAVHDSADCCKEEQFDEHTAAVEDPFIHGEPFVEKKSTFQVCAHHAILLPHPCFDKY